MDPGWPRVRRDGYELNLTTGHVRFCAECHPSGLTPRRVVTHEARRPHDDRALPEEVLGQVLDERPIREDLDEIEVDTLRLIRALKGIDHGPALDGDPSAQGVGGWVQDGQSGLDRECQHGDVAGAPRVATCA